MQRSPQLQPLSREHHTALVLAKVCERSADADAATIKAACQRVIQSYADELHPHFQIEEQTLLPLLQGTPEQALAERTLHDHRQLAELRERMQAPDADALRQFGKILMAHVRFEERELFPALERYLDQPEPRQPPSRDSK